MRSIRDIIGGILADLNEKERQADEREWQEFKQKVPSIGEARVFVELVGWMETVQKRLAVLEATCSITQK